MKTAREIRARIRTIKSDYGHVLIGSMATIHINAPRAMMQIAAENQLHTLHWMLGTKYKSKLKGKE